MESLAIPDVAVAPPAVPGVPGLDGVLGVELGGPWGPFRVMLCSGGLDLLAAGGCCCCCAAAELEDAVDCATELAAAVKAELGCLSLLPVRTMPISSLPVLCIPLDDC